MIHIVSDTVYFSTPYYINMFFSVTIATVQHLKPVRCAADDSGQRNIFHDAN